jgi:hypothetical protein
MVFPVVKVHAVFLLNNVLQKDGPQNNGLLSLTEFWASSLAI